jgi:poly-gamma-glutamate synthesis protein (capsule biosynthesis protein)
MSERAQERMITVWVDPAVDGLFEISEPLLQVQGEAEAAFDLSLGDDAVVAEWIYALVAPFPELRDGVTGVELLGQWKGGEDRFSNQPLLVSGQTSAILSRLWGEPGEEAVQVHAETELLARSWTERPSWAIVPFEHLHPGWKVLEVDGQSPIRKDFDSVNYPLVVRLSLEGEPPENLKQTESSTLPRLIPASNRNPNKMTVVALTGVTALVRATAWTMEQMGIDYPARDIGHWLNEADIAHISNEVPFAENCPFPNPTQLGVEFCSDVRYIELLEDVGTDVVELTGDHFHDWGPQAMLYTLDLYDARGWLSYGGGATHDEGRQPVMIEHNGNRLAFIGCNGKGGSFARATETSPGSVKCDFTWLQEHIARLVSEGVIVIAVVRLTFPMVWSSAVTP